MAALGEPLWGQSLVATIVDVDGRSRKINAVRVVTEANGRWEGGVPPRQTVDRFWIYMEGGGSGGPWNDRSEVKLADIKSLSMTGAWDCVWSGEQVGFLGREAALDIQFRDGRRLLLKKWLTKKDPPWEPEATYTEYGKDGTEQKTLPIYTWRLKGGSVSDARGRTTGSTLEKIVGHAPNPLGRESDFSIPVCRVRSLQFE